MEQDVTRPDADAEKRVRMPLAQVDFDKRAGQRHERFPIGHRGAPGGICCRKKAAACSGWENTDLKKASFGEAARGSSDTAAGGSEGPAESDGEAEGVDAGIGIGPAAVGMMEEIGAGEQRETR